MRIKERVLQTINKRIHAGYLNKTRHVHSKKARIGKRIDSIKSEELNFYDDEGIDEDSGEDYCDE